MTPDYENLMCLLGSRRSCRGFAPEALESPVLEALHAAFALAPQAGGGRNLTCSFITDRAHIQELANAGAAAFAALCEGMPSSFIREEMIRYGENFFWFGAAPALAYVTCRKAPAFLQDAAGEKASSLWGGELSGAMASFSLMLAAESLGLGACCLTGPLAVWRIMEERLAVPQRECLVLLLALGNKG